MRSSIIRNRKTVMTRPIVITVVFSTIFIIVAMNVFRKFSCVGFGNNLFVFEHKSKSGTCATD